MRNFIVSLTGAIRKSNAAIVLALTVCGFTASAQFNFTITNGAATITGYTGFAGAVVIPSSIGGVPVTSIGANAFLGSGVTQVSIPSGVTNIGDSAFAGSQNLGEVTIPATVTTIGSNAFGNCNLASLTLPSGVISLGGLAFQGCEGLTSVTIPASVTNIEVAPFFGCYFLASINVVSGNPAYTSQGGVLFDAGVSLLVECPPALSGDYTIPNSVTTVGDYAFAQCFSVTNVQFGSGVTQIGNEAFLDCNLTSVIIPSGVTSIGNYAFQDCASLTGATIPASTTNVGAAPFQGCPAATITVLGGNPSYISVGGVLFNNDETQLLEYPQGAATNYTIPDTVTSIADSAFAECSSLRGISIPNIVTNIGVAAFSGCGFPSITIPNSVIAIGAGAFSNSVVSSVTFGSGLVSIGDLAFSQCPSLAAVTIPAGVTNVGVAPFTGCSEVTAINVAAGNSAYASIGGVLFNHDQTALIEYPGGGLGPYAVPTGVNRIGDYSFAGSTLYEAVALPSSVTNVGNYAFAGSTLNIITFPACVNTFGNGVLSQCSWLTNAYFQGDAPNSDWTMFAGSAASTVFNYPGSSNWGEALGGIATSPAFDYTSNNGAITITDFNVDFAAGFAIPSSQFGLPVTTIGFFDNQQLVNVTIPASVTNIGIGAFEECANLSAINVVTNNPDYSSVAGVLFDRALTTLFEYPSGASALSYTIPNSITSIGTSAFRNCVHLDGITLPNGLTNISGDAFDECTRLASIVIPNGITDLADSVFAGCSRLTDVVIPPGVTNIGDDTFTECSSLQSMIIPAKVVNVGDFAFYECGSLTNVTFLNSPASIGEFAFFNSGLLSVNFGNAVTSIGAEAFQECGLASVILPDTVTYLGVEAFYECSGLTNAVIGAGLTNLSDQAFADDNLQTAFFSGNAPSVDNTVFSGDTVLIFYTPGTTGWGPTFGGETTAVWPLEITSEPVSVAVIPGTDAQFSLGTTGPPAPLVYSWFFNNVLIDGATNATLLIDNAQAANSGNYEAIALDDFQAVTSSVASLTILPSISAGSQFAISGPANLINLQSFGGSNEPETTYSWAKVSGLQQVFFANPNTPTNSSTISSGLDQITITDPASTLTSIIFGFAGTYELAALETTGTNVSQVEATVTVGVDTNGMFQDVSNLVNGDLLTNGTTFLSHAPFTNDATDAANYYSAIDPTDSKTDLTAWKIANGIPTNAIPPATTNFNGVVAATYMNCLDLGFARRMIMSGNGTGDWAYAVANYPNLADAISDTNKIATVTMDYSAVPPGTNRFTKFYVYGANDQRLSEANLDGGGNRFVPGLCEVCHGGLGGPVNAGQGDVHAHFLAFDVRALDYASSNNLTQAALEPELKLLNAGVLAIEQDIGNEDAMNFSPTITNLVQGWYGTGLTNPVQNVNFVPAAWQDQSLTGTLSLAGQVYLYKNVIAPSCRSCHETRTVSQLPDFRSFSNFVANAGLVRYDVFGANGIGTSPVAMNPTLMPGVFTMPQARRTFQRFWNSLAPRPQAEILAAYLNGLLDHNLTVSYPPAAAPSLSIQQIGRDVVIDFSAVGGSYVVQTGTNLLSPFWAVLPGTIAGDGGFLQIVEPISPGQPVNFYQINGQP